MTTSSPVERVIAFLSRFDYRLLPPPIVINQSKFHFSAVLMGPEGASDIILVVDTVETKDVEIVRRVQGVARALDVVRSSNPLTAILVGPRPHPEHLTEIMQVCRLLPIGTIPANDSDAEAILSNWLAVLTPLDQIDTDGVVADPMAALANRLEGLNKEVAGLSEYAPNGAKAVERAVNALYEQRLLPVIGDAE